MNFQSITNSKFGVRLGLELGQRLPTVASYPLVNFIAGRLARLENLSLVQSVRNNQQVINNGQLTPCDLNKIVTEVFTYAGRCLIDFYSGLKSPAELQKKVLKNEALERLIMLSQNKDFGAFLVMPHMSSFDLLFMAAAAQGFKTKVLTFGKPTSGYKLQNELRATSGLEIMPVSRQAHAKSIETLRNGGFILTAIDRPMPKQNRRLNFFGRPSPLPAGHIRMALEADVPILVAAVHMNKDGLYQLSLSKPIPMIRMADPTKEIRWNAENILHIIEGYIRSHPSQWQMYYPVWPDRPFSRN